MKQCKYCDNIIPDNLKYCTNCGKNEFFDPQKTVTEYKRICNECGTEWHSLQSREIEIENEIRNPNKQSSQGSQCCNMCSSGGNKNQPLQKETPETELKRLKTCPQCKSGNYKEELLKYEKK